jgi:MarR family transcriptional regulator, organic hydroperoxide resistance regulator
MTARKRIRPLGGEEETRRILRHWHEDVPNDRLAHLVKDASRAFVRALKARLELHGVSFGHWTFLRILWEADGLTQRELSAEAGVMEPTTHVALNAMEKLGYIRRRRRPANRRNVYVYLTAKGRALKSTLVPLAEDVNRIGVDGIAASDVAAARRVLVAIIDNLARNGDVATER